MTEVYVFCRGAEPLEEALALCLPPWRQQRLAQINYPSARQESLAAGLLYAFALARRGLPLDEPVTLLGAGKPVLARQSEVHFSLSHSGPWAMCAISDRPVGVDVQQVRPVKLSIARRFHPQEREWLSRQTEGEQQAEFFRLWTRKEAWVKAQSREKMLALNQADVIHRLPGWQFRDYTLAPDFPAALCVQGADGPLCPQVIEREVLLAALS
jgi:4'-phosphopantetheinyl transferase